MRKLIVAIVAFALTSCTTFTLVKSDLPFSTMQEVLGAVTAQQTGQCRSDEGPQQVFFAKLEKSGRVFSMMGSPDGRAVLAELVDDMPIAIYHLQVKDGKLSVLRKEAFDHVKHGLGPCSVLFPPKA